MFGRHDLMLCLMARQKSWASHCQRLYAKKGRQQYHITGPMQKSKALCCKGWHSAVDLGAHCRHLQGKLMYLVHNTDFVVATRPAAAFVTMACLAQAVQHVCSRLVGVEFR